jgi:multiple sugar transport system permease protein
VRPRRAAEPAMSTSTAASRLGGAPASAGAPPFNALKNRFYWRLVTPTFAVLVVVTLLPTLYLLLTSFTPLDLTHPDTIWNFSQPLGNYRLLIEDGRLHDSLWTQVKLSFWTVGLQLLLGLGFALLLNLRSSLLQALRTIFLIPMVLPPIVVAIIWKVLYTPDISPIWWLFGALGWDVPSLITSADWALTAIVIADTWEWFPFTMLMILAALQMMPEEYVDAARIDGATAWQMTLHVTLPYVKGVLLVAGLFRLIDSIKAFPLIYILTDGGPGTVTEVTNYYSFIQAFNFSYLGYSSAITVVMVVITLLLSWGIIHMVGWGQKGGE